jgi:hypothetical protein
MKPTNSTVNIGTSTSSQTLFGTKTRTISINMPICPDCLEHENKLASSRRLIVILPVLFAFISGYLIRGVDVQEEIFWILPLVVAVVTFFLLNWKIELPELGEEHSTWRKSVRLSGLKISGNKMTYIFTNWRYAKSLKGNTKLFVGVGFNF